MKYKPKTNNILLKFFCATGSSMIASRFSYPIFFAGFLALGAWCGGLLVPWGYGGPLFRAVKAEASKIQQRSLVFKDDDCAAKTPPFDPDFVDPPSGSGGWALNSSGVVISLKIIPSNEDDRYKLDSLHPSFGKCLEEISGLGFKLLPSVDTVLGKAKQFDDGMLAVLEMEGAYKGFRDVPPLLIWFDQLKQALPPGGHARAFLEESLNTMNRGPDCGFYYWNENLAHILKLRWSLQVPNQDQEVTQEILEAFRNHPELSDGYKALLQFDARLSGPATNLTFEDLLEREKSSNTRENFRKKNEESLGDRFVTIFPMRLGPEHNLLRLCEYLTDWKKGDTLMVRLVQAIQDGKIDLQPKPGSGWYIWHLYGLEALLSLGKARESEKLCLAKEYKERLFQAFQAGLTFRRESFLRDKINFAAASIDEASWTAFPELRIEPNPTFYLRMARSYRTLEEILTAGLEPAKLSQLKGLTEEGERALSLAEEVRWMKQWLYGLHAVACEDLGMPPFWDAGEIKAPEQCKEAALEWLATWPQDADLKVDVRYVVPYDEDFQWATVGVRAVKLDAAYEKAPRWRPAKGRSEWQLFTNTEPSRYAMCVTQFLEFHNRNRFSREDLKKVCDEKPSLADVRESLSEASGSGIRWPKWIVW